MIITPTPENVAFFKALASDIRLQVIQLLAERNLSIKELAELTGVSSPIMLKHVRMLEENGFVTSSLVRQNGSISRVCTLVFAEYRLIIEARRRGLPADYTVSIPVGTYSDIYPAPTCGLLTEKEQIGVSDDPRCFWDPARVDAQLIWFTKGYVEYRIPARIDADRMPKEIELSFEIASEAPDFAEDWPSDITFSMNGVRLFSWTSPGDYGVKRGVLTPEWWPSNQYGLLKMIRITPEGSWMDDRKMSDVTIFDVLGEESLSWTIRFEVPEDAEHVGGLSLFGSRFGNYAQDILFRLFY